MTTIVLVVIGVLLAAVAALMVVFYGGDAFGGGVVRANAATLMNAGLNVESASEGYHAATGVLPSAYADLKGSLEADWVHGDPALAGIASAAGEISDVGASRYYLVRGVADRKVCARVNAEYRLGVVDVPTAIGSVSHGCFSNAGDMTFFVRLGAAESAVGGASSPSSPTAPAPAAQPVVGDTPPNGSTIAVSASYIRSLGALGQYLATRQGADPLSEDPVAMGFSPRNLNAFGYASLEYAGEVGGLFIVRRGGFRFALLRNDDGVRYNALCRSLNVAGGGPDEYRRYDIDEMAAQGEGCGSTPYAVAYWRRLG